jgi:fluoride exporter
MRSILLVATGGALGSTARYLVSGWVQRGTTAFFPFGTLTVNVVGCLCIGLLGGWGERRLGIGPDVRAFVMIGILGGFTTFSSFAYDTLALGRDGDTMLAFANVAANMLLCLGAAWLGMVVGRLT